ncbi:MAG: helix-turn-helix domain-containing protein [Victivallales bacterium]|nr:helix-turn-helix domain-containing protein [Victivallales bacterium]
MSIPLDVLDLACYPLKRHLPHITPELLGKALDMARTDKSEVNPGALLTVKEVSAHLHISTCTIWRMIQAGKIKTVIIGDRCRRIPESEVFRLGMVK